MPEPTFEPPVTLSYLHPHAATNEPVTLLEDPVRDASRRRRRESRILEIELPVMRAGVYVHVLQLSPRDR
jgi:hypothetical protein